MKPLTSVSRTGALEPSVLVTEITDFDKVNALDKSSSMAELRECINDLELNISTSGPGRNKAAVLADITKSISQIKAAAAKSAKSANTLNDASSMREMRDYIKSNNLQIATTGLGRNKAAVLADIQEADKKIVVTVNADSKMHDLRAFIKDNDLKIATVGTGRNKQAVYADIVAACK
jgi:tRNA C32,U32 (ribose-2'-O)-methylase TrmJ